MKQLVEIDEWTVVQEGFDPEHQRIYESLFSLGNGHMGGRGNHEEAYSGDTLPGNYLAGVYYPDPTRVGWWKNGYPDYFAKILNAADWTPIRIAVDGTALDLDIAEVLAYRRTLDLRAGDLKRSFKARLPNATMVDVDVTTIVSMARKHLGAIRYRITPVNNVTLHLSLQVNGDVVNEDSNYDEGFWDEVSQSAEGHRASVVSRTKKTQFECATAMAFEVRVDDVLVDPATEAVTATRFASVDLELDVAAGQTVDIIKFGANATSREMPAADVEACCHDVLDQALADGFDEVHREHVAAWARIWELGDVVIGGDPAAQQGIRFNIFQLNSTFTGDDPDLNIGPKGFTGEKYGGVTYWDTEAFCLPFYLATSEPDVARNLLRYRHRQLDRAIENAGKLGFNRGAQEQGAALYPMVTINGEECHNEWEITFEEIHRNGAIAFAIFNYLRYTGDDEYLLEGGLEVLIAIARFWAQRVSFSEAKQQYVILGVTGPNEYENNVDNNWYTNLMAQWTLRHAAEAIDIARSLEMDGATERVDAILDDVDFAEATERSRWSAIAEGLHFPSDPARDIFLQQGNYLDKELLTVDDLDPADRPIHKHWSWDRILRSPFIKQADVLQGLWVFEERFDLDTIRRNFDFYEPRTVHESSLSPSIHAVLAVRLGRLDKAHEMMLRTARLDLDDINADTEDGCHTTSMAGTWIAAVQGFGGLQVIDDALHLDPNLPPGWTELTFQVQFRGAWISVAATPDGVTIHNRSDVASDVRVGGTSHPLDPAATLTLSA